MAASGLTHYYAVCTHCGRKCVARNALGWAHQHVKRNPSHGVEVQLAYYVSSSPAPSKKETESDLLL